MMASMSGPDDIAPGLLAPEEAIARPVSGKTDAAVLVPLYDGPSGLTCVFTERRHDLRRHPGEISFPGGRRDPGEDLIQTALREADEEIGLASGRVTVIGALAPVASFATRYRIYPFVAMIERPEVWRPSPTEVAEILEFPLDALVASYRRERLWSKRVPIRTPTFRVDGHLVWGATALLTEQMLRRTGLI